MLAEVNRSILQILNAKRANRLHDVGAHALQGRVVCCTRWRVCAVARMLGCVAGAWRGVVFTKLHSRFHFTFSKITKHFNYQKSFRAESGENSNSDPPCKSTHLAFWAVRRTQCAWLPDLSNPAF